MTYSGERSSKQIGWLSEEYPAVTIALSIRLILPGIELPSASIGMAPQIPYDLLDVLWLQGLCEGVHDAVQQAGFSYATSSVRVDFRNLSFPVQLDALTVEELEKLRILLSATVRDSMTVLLAEMSQVDRPEMSTETAYDLLELHSGHQSGDDERKGWIGLLNESYLEAMAHNQGAPATPHLDGLATAFQEIMTSLTKLSDDYQSHKEADKVLVAALWTISHKGKRLGLANLEMRRGVAIEEWQRVSHWADTIEYVAEEIVTGLSLDIPVLLKIALEKDYGGVKRF